MNLARMLRLPLVALLALYAATGVASTGAGLPTRTLAEALVPVMGFLVFAVLVNDLSDEEIDRVNLAGDRGRLLVCGAASRRELRLAAAAAATVAVAGSLVLPRPVTLVTVCGLVLAAAYSCRPVRLAERGAVASLVLPAGYVSVPFLVGVCTTGASFPAADVPLLVGLYIGFIGRIVLKDFRDVRGDLLYGKRTFLIRHGRRATCWCSACCWAAGAVVLSTTRAFAAPDVPLVALAVALVLVLGAEGSHRRDELLISAIAVLGRGVVVSLLAQLCMTAAHWSSANRTGALSVLAAVMMGQAATMARRPPRTGLRAPATWAAPADALPGDDRTGTRAVAPLAAAPAGRSGAEG